MSSASSAYIIKDQGLWRSRSYSEFQTRLLLTVFAVFMSRYLIGLFLSFLLSNWVYSEIALIVPGFDTLCRAVYQHTKLPTHDRWDTIFSGAPGSELRAHVETGIKAAEKVPWLGSILRVSGVSDPQVRSFENFHFDQPQAAKNFVKLFDEIDSVAAPKPDVENDFVRL